MNDKTLTALEDSIKYWETIVSGEIDVSGIDGCALCREFNSAQIRQNRAECYSDPRQNCVGCPVSQATGKEYCKGSPYDELVRSGITEATKPIHKRELEFLKSLLPTETTNDKQPHIQEA